MVRIHTKKEPENPPKFKKINEEQSDLNDIQQKNLIKLMLKFGKSKEYAYLKKNFDFDEPAVYSSIFYYEIFGNRNDNILLMHDTQYGPGYIINLKDYSVKGILLKWMGPPKANQPTKPLSPKSRIRKTQKLNFTYELWQVEDGRFFYVDVPSGSIR